MVKADLLSSKQAMMLFLRFKQVQNNAKICIIDPQSDFLISSPELPPPEDQCISQAFWE